MMLITMMKNKQKQPEIHAKNNVLSTDAKTIIICWNSDFPEHIKLNHGQIELKPAKNEDELHTYLRDCKNILGFVILCELRWCIDGLNFQYSALSGIKLSKQLRIMKAMCEPILFVSFLSRKQILKINVEQNKIITVIGSEFCQLPQGISSCDWTEKLSKTGNLSEVGLIDVKMHYCDPKGMLAELKHDISKRLNSLPNDNMLFFEQTKENIGLIYSKTLPSDLLTLFDLPHATKQDFNNKLSKICLEIDNLKLLADPENEYSFSKNIDFKDTDRYKCLILDDEIETESLQKLVSQLTKIGFDVIECSESKEAWTIIEHDIFNHIDVVIADYRLWHEDEGIMVHQSLQGFDFITKCCALGQSYYYVVLSALDRNFLMERFGVQAKVRYKNGVLANVESIGNFCNDIKEWAKAKKKNMACKITNNEWFGKIYNWSRDSDDKVAIEAKITELADKAIENLKSINNKLSCNSKINCNRCILEEIKKTDFAFSSLSTSFGTTKNRTDWNPESDKHQDIAIQKLAARRVWLFCKGFLIKVGCTNAERSAMQAIHFVKGNIFSKISDASGRTNYDSAANEAEFYKNLWLTKKSTKKTDEETFWLNKHPLL